MGCIPTSGGSVQTPQYMTFFAGLRSAGGAAASAMIVGWITCY